MAAYYYAAGRQVPLEPDDDRVAVDWPAAERAGLEREVRQAADAPPRPGAGVVLVPRAALDATTIARLRDAGAMRPVYRHERATMVALPEVRVEFDTPAQRQAVLDMLGRADTLPHAIADSTEDRLVLRPASGTGEDALDLANAIYERARPAASSVRFLQFVPKPSVR
jgi:hypothetical protein